MNKVLCIHLFKKKVIFDAALCQQLNTKYVISVLYQWAQTDQTLPLLSVKSKLL